jgi:pimeloyl-ACP methyl ester carboxylesterase
MDDELREPDELAVSIADELRLNVRRWAGPGFADGSRAAGSAGSTRFRDRPPFLLVHGLASNARLWDGVAAVLARAGHAAYAVDLRGHGRSDCPADGHDTATAAADLAAVATALELGPAIVAGQSWGGNVAVRFAAEHPALVAALALVDGGWIDLPARFGSWAACAAALRPPELDHVHVDDLRGGLRGAHPDWSDAAVEATVANLRIGPDGFVARRLPIDRHMAIVRSMYDDPPERFFPALAMPTLLMPAMPTRAGEAARVRAAINGAATAIPRARIREYAGADHDLHAQQPGRVADDLLALAKEARA